MSSRGEGAAPRSGRTRLLVLVIVVAVMVLLTAGWPLLNLAVSDNRAVAANTRLTVGISHRSSGTVTVGPGWTMQSAQSDPQDSYSLHRGSAEMSLDYVNLISMAQIRHLWDGLRQIEQVYHPGSRLSKPAPITSAGGYRGLAGSLVYKGMAGTAAIFASPSGKFAIEMTVLSPRGTAVAIAAPAIRTIRSLRFPRGAA
jgi:hypothetical protein